MYSKRSVWIVFAFVSHSCSCCAQSRHIIDSRLVTRYHRHEHIQVWTEHSAQRVFSMGDPSVGRCGFRLDDGREDRVYAIGACQDVFLGQLQQQAEQYPL